MIIMFSSGTKWTSGNITREVLICACDHDFQKDFLDE